VSTTVNAFSTFINVGITCDSTLGSNQIAYYRNGSADGTNTGSPAATTWDSCISNAANERLNGQIACMYYWSGRILTAGEMSSLNTDPYEVVTAAAAGGGVSLLRSSKLYRPSLIG
jgi:hypothetical protein